MTEIVTSLKPGRPRFSPRPFCMGFMVNNMTPGQVFLHVFQFFSDTVIKLMFHTLLSVTNAT